MLNLEQNAPPEAAGASLELVQQLNREHFKPRSDQLELEARIASFELAARMQLAATEALDLSKESKETHALYQTGEKDAAAKRDVIANALRPVQLERARAASVLWKAKPLDAAANSVDIPESWQDGAPQTTASVDMKKAVENIQRILNKNGYDAGDADGVAKVCVELSFRRKHQEVTTKSLITLWLVIFILM